MPCYLFTYHAYMSWLPDRKRGYVRRKKGILPRDPKAADQYRKNARESPVQFDHGMQKIMIDEAHVAATHQRHQVRGIGTDPTHIHELVTWNDGQTWETLRNGIRYSLTRRLNREFGKRTWFVESASRKRVTTREHYDHLVNTYLPDHPGWKWSPEKGMYL